MRKFIVRATAFLGVQALIAAALFAVYLNTGNPAQSYLSAYGDKSALLARADEPKLIFVGGSNVALGLDSGRAADALPYHPVNAGLMTGIGTPMMLAQIEPHLRPGDVIVLSPEYDRWGQELEPHTVFRLLEDNPGAWRDIPPGYAPELLDASFSYVGQALRSVLGRGGRARTHNPPFERAGFNRFGDFTRHRDLPRLERLGTPLVVPAVGDEALEDAVAQLNAFHRRAVHAGVTVFVSFPPLPRDVYETRASDIRQLHGYLQRELDIPLLDSPQDLALPAELFYDTIYHLNGAGTARRMDHLTARLVDDLRLAAAEAG